jgi:integrase/recombinase XerD
MAFLRVVRKVKVEGKWQFLPVAKQGNKLDWTHLSHRGVPMVSTAGTFYLDYREGGRRIRRAIGDHPRDAKAALASQMSVINLREAGMQVDDAPQIQAYRPVSGKSISEVVSNFIAHPPLKLRKRSIAKYRNALTSFAKWTGNTHVSQISRDDLKNFMSHVVNAEGLDHSTAVDKAIIVQAVMSEHGAEIKMKKGDWPRVTAQQPEVYEPDVTEKLFASANEREFILFQTFLMTGFRDQEVGFLSWNDFNLRTSTLSVSKKVELGFDPKNYQERTIPIPEALIALLQKHKKTQDNEYLVFPTSRHNTQKGCPGGQRDRHMLDTLKKLAYRAGLNCGRCEGTWLNKTTTCAKAPICCKFGLHKFRHTYATTLLRDGVDLVSLQKLLGHNDMDSTRKYLRALEPADLLKKINLTTLSTRFYSGARSQ